MKTVERSAAVMTDQALLCEILKSIQRACGIEILPMSLVDSDQVQDVCNDHSEVSIAASDIPR